MGDPPPKLANAKFLILRLGKVLVMTPKDSGTEKDMARPFKVRNAINSVPVRASEHPRVHPVNMTVPVRNTGRVPITSQIAPNMSKVQLRASAYGRRPQ